MIPRRPASAGRSAEARLAALGIELPAPRRPTTSQVAAVRSGTLLFLSGHGPLRDGRVVYQGRVGQDLTLTEGRAAARLTGLNLLASTRAALGSLDRVRRVVRALGMVQCPADFTDHPKVINGFSDLMVEVFGEAGRHARSAVGAASLPLGMAVQIEVILEVAGNGGGAAPARRRAAANAARRSSSSALRGIAPTPPTDQYVPAVTAAARLFVAGHDPERGGRLAFRGRVGGAVPVDRAGAALRLATANALVSARTALGSLDRARCVVLTAFVSATTPAGLDPTLLRDSLALLEAVLAPGNPPAVWLRPAQGLAGGMPVEVELVLEIPPRRAERPVRVRRRRRSGARTAGRGPRRSAGRTS